MFTVSSTCETKGAELNHLDRKITVFSSNQIFVAVEYLKYMKNIGFHNIVLLCSTSNYVLPSNNSNPIVHMLAGWMRRRPDL